jgi:hypothetical protein
MFRLKSKPLRCYRIQNIIHCYMRNRMHSPIIKILQGVYVAELYEKILFLGGASCCIRYQDFIMVAVNRNEVFYLFSLFQSRHYMFRPVRAIFR